ncbi:hypothetical protein [Streptomyces lichenis]|uniref:MmpS family membrane protein n=1 Tax=Streptomyces lichenis TaxID=2306967 RepID=A0ABT0I7K8_9ACTN|nr:hypothetical protein [Streptomyces lichenis]MCK8677310.1 hypothetical protein [Streptomyces lichenis]
MDKKTTTTALLLAAALLTGCGSGSDGGDTGGKATGDASKPPTAGSPSPSEGTKTEGASHEVTLEVTGKGKTMIMYTLDESKTETVTLPWKRTATITPEGAEKEVGRLVLVTPGNSLGENGMLTAGGCTITVDGKQVADNDGGKSPKPCTYEIK